ncbi:MAG: hypothetical protein ACFCUI_08300 [Bernardetiaceae bacterium]
MLTHDDDEFDFNLDDDDQSTPRPRFTNPQPPKDARASKKDIDLSQVRIDGLNGSPLVIFFGPGRIGKTVALLRFAEYVRGKKGLVITPNEAFGSDPSYAGHYSDTVLPRFEEMLRFINVAPERTNEVDFLLLDVFRNGNPYCQLLEASGEHFIKTTPTFTMDHEYPAYLEEIFGNATKKIYLFFLAYNAFNPRDRSIYAQHIASFLDSGRVQQDRDKVAILYTQVDRSKFINKGKPNVDALRNDFYGNPGYDPLTTYLRGSQFARIPFIPYSAGRFQNDKKGAAWTKSPDIYSQILWEHLDRFVRGARWF